MSEAVCRKIGNENRENKYDAEGGLRIIGVGLPRTGTNSLKKALEILGFGPCHHIVVLMKTPDRMIEFTRAYDGENVDFHALMKGYGSTVDTPTVDFYKEIHQVYPQAKFILTVRDDGEKWFESYQNTVGSVFPNKFHYFCVYFVRNFRLQYNMVCKMLRKWRREYGENGPSVHDQHNRRMVNDIKEGDVLVFNVKERWPLGPCGGLRTPDSEGVGIAKKYFSESESE